MPEKKYASSILIRFHFTIQNIPLENMKMLHFPLLLFTAVIKKLQELVQQQKQPHHHNLELLRKLAVVMAGKTQMCKLSTKILFADVIQNTVS